jgi:hypothetical protein
MFAPLSAETCSEEVLVDEITRLGHVDDSDEIVVVEGGIFFAG